MTAGTVGKTPAAPRSTEGHMGRRALEVLLWAVLLTGIWVSTLTTVDGPELVAAGVCALAAGVLGTATRTTLGATLRPRPGWLRWLVLLPVAVVADLGRLTVAVVAALRHGRGLGVPRTLALPDEPGIRARTRQALGSVAVSATPGTYVTGVTGDGALELHALTAQASALERAVAR